MTPGLAFQDFSIKLKYCTGVSPTLAFAKCGTYICTWGAPIVWCNNVILKISRDCSEQQFSLSTAASCLLKKFLAPWCCKEQNTAFEALSAASHVDTASSCDSWAVFVHTSTTWKLPVSASLKFIHLCGQYIVLPKSQDWRRRLSPDWALVLRGETAAVALKRQKNLNSACH